MKNKRFIIFLIFLMILILGATSVSASEDNNLVELYEYQNSIFDNSQSIPEYTDYNSDNFGINSSTEDFSTNKDIKKTTLLTMDSMEESQYSDTIIIAGKITDINNNALKNMPLKLNINEKVFETISDSNGKYSHKYKTNAVGVNNLTVMFEGNDEYLDSTINQTLIVNRKSTEVIIDNISDCQYSDMITLSGRYVDVSNNSLRYTPLIIDINANRYVTQTDVNGNYYYKFKANKLELNTISVSYPGNMRYEGSTRNLTFNVTRKSTRILLNELPDAEYSDVISISGRYVDVSNNSLRYTPLIVEINGKKYNTVTDINGKYAFNYKIYNVGNNVINVSYPGNSRYEGNYNYTTFYVGRKSTKIIINPLPDVEYSDVISISGRYVDAGNNSLRYTPLNININANRYVTQTDVNGYYVFRYKTNKIGLNTLKIDYPGNNRYIGDSNEVAFNVERKHTTVTIYNINENRYLSTMSIKGNYRDTSNNNLRYTTLIVSINGNTYYTKTDENGEYAYDYKIDSIGRINISVSYPGNLRYVGDNSTASVDVVFDRIIVVSSEDSKSVDTDSGNENAIVKSIATLNGKPDLSKLGDDYRFADENGSYIITGSEIRRVMTLDSWCQQLYGYVPKYTFFRTIDSNVKYVISREKWNVIARTLNEYHVRQGYRSVDTPYAVIVNISGKGRYYPVFYDAQEWINGHQYTCGPTSMSMISQALNCYSSERKLSGVYHTTSSYGTEESAIINYSPNVLMRLTNIVNNKGSVISTLQSGKMVYWHIRGHYMCVVAYNSNTDRFLCLNPSGPSHYIAAVQWATWTEMMNTDRPLKENGFMAVTPDWHLSSSDIAHAKNYYNNMGGKYYSPSNKEYPNDDRYNSLLTVNKISDILI